MTIQTKEDVSQLRKIGEIVALTRQAMINALAVGMSTQELDQIGRDVLTRHGARPAPELCYGFPGATCISINEQVAHAIPGPRKIRNGDLVNIDVSAELEATLRTPAQVSPLAIPQRWPSACVRPRARRYKLVYTLLAPVTKWPSYSA